MCFKTQTFFFGYYLGKVLIVLLLSWIAYLLVNMLKKDQKRQ
jgi:uncharacterized PurR-regulated membrane protein YhhQ (DUF165 family)